MMYLVLALMLAFNFSLFNLCLKNINVVFISEYYPAEQIKLSITN